MNTEKTITICGKDVKMRYCAATETCFESLSGKKIDVFLSTPTEWDADGKATRFNQPQATTEDYITLAISAIIAAYSRTGEDTPVKSVEILYDATPQEVTELLKTAAKLRMEWYSVPDVVTPDIKPERKGRKPKNA